MAARPHQNGNGRESIEVRLSHLEEWRKDATIRSDNLVRSIADLENQIIQAGKTTPLQAFVVIATAIAPAIMLWNFAVQPIVTDVSSLETRLNGTETKLQERIYRVEQNAPNKEALNEHLLRFTDKLTRLENDLAALALASTTKTEFDLRRASTDKAFEDVRAQYTTLRASFNEFSPPRRIWEDLTQRLERLEAIRLNHVPPKNSEVGNGSPAG